MTSESGRIKRRSSNDSHWPGPNKSRYARAMADDPNLEMNEPSAPNASSTQRERRGPPPNPLYHPLFLPVLLIGFSLWFGYDGFLTTDEDMLKHQGFNRIMFAIMLPICLWMVPRGIREFREEQATAARKQGDGKSN